MKVTGVFKGRAVALEALAEFLLKRGHIKNIKLT
jgi:hypothetical protein